jgi:hypothetical protein
MRSRRFLFALCTVSLIVAGCRQPDGALPTEGPEDKSRWNDVARDLQNIAGGDANGPQEFADDIKVWATPIAGRWAPADELGQRVTTALKGKTLPDDGAAQLARFFWIAAAARDLSERQTERLQDDIKEALVKLGAAEAAATAVGEQIGTLQEAVTRKERRWYQLF